MKKQWHKKRLLISTIVAFLVVAVGSVSYAYVVAPQRGSDAVASEQRSDSSSTVTSDTSPQAFLVAENKIRSEHGAPALQLNEALNTSAMQKCRDMADNSYFAHLSPATGKHGYELAEGSYAVPGRYSENISYRTVARSGYSNSPTANAIMTPSTFLDGWMNSQPHREAMLDPGYTLTGFAVCSTHDAESDTTPARAYKWYAVQHFYNQN